MKGEVAVPVYAVSYQHPDEEGWARHVMPHVQWLRERLGDGSLLASGPLAHLDVRAALLIMTAPDRESLERLIATDPFALEGLIEDMVINEWDPLFGAFNASSSIPARTQG